MIDSTRGFRLVFTTGLIWTCVIGAFSQNLVPNPSFEEVAEEFCQMPIPREKFERSVKGWRMPTANTPFMYSTSVDTECWGYFKPEWGVPKSGSKVVSILLYRDQLVSPVSSGHIMAMTAYPQVAIPETHWETYRSYLQVPLTEELKEGKTYYTEISLLQVKYAALACNNLGLHFSDTLVRLDQYDEVWDYDSATHKMGITRTIGLPYFGRLALPPDVLHTELLTDTTNWMVLHSKFKARSNAKYLIIGNFLSNAETKHLGVRENRNTISKDGAALYFVDDIYVGETPRKKGEER